MGKRSKERITQEIDEPVAVEGLSDLSTKNKRKKQKNKTSQDVMNPETPIGGEGGCKKTSSKVLGNTECQSHKKKNKYPSNQIDSTVSDQEVFTKQKKQKKKDIEKHSKVYTESNDSSFDRNKKKKKKRKLDAESEIEEPKNITPLYIEESNSIKKHKVFPPAHEIETSINSHSDKLLKKKKKKIAVGTAGETEPNNECLDVADINTKPKKMKKKHRLLENQQEDILEEPNNECLDVADVNTKPKKKKKKHRLLENQQEDILIKSMNNLNESIESTNKDKKKNTIKVTESELSADSIPYKTKPVTVKFNAEEAAVTEEEINQFCDEIDEEDNKQYEDWVRLLENMLGPKKCN